MNLLTQEEARQLLERVLRYATADETVVELSGSLEGNIRYARNEVSTSGEIQSMTLSVQSAYGKRSGTATITEFDEESLKKVVQRAEELAKLAPENEEYMPLLGPQTYPAATNSYFDSTAAIDPDFRAKVAEISIRTAEEAKMVVAGFFEHASGFSAQMNSKGLFAYHRSTGGDLNLTVRNAEGTGSGYASQSENNISRLDAKAVSERAVRKATGSVGAVAIEPGKYTVVLEPLAAADMIRLMVGNMNQRSAEEGRSFLSKAGGATRLGEKLFDERVTLFSDPSYADLPARPWNGEGYPLTKQVWVENGIVKQLPNSRYWAQKTNKPYLPNGNNLIMLGGDQSLEDLIRGTERGILVTRFWYIRPVDPKTLLYTGLTRDGTFLIENGKVTKPIKNFRYNESPVIMLNNLDALGKPERVAGGGGGAGGGSTIIPPMRIRDFTFTSLSDAV